MIDVQFLIRYPLVAMDSFEALFRYFDKLRDELLCQQNVRSRLHMFKASAIGALFYFAARSLRDDPLVTVIALALAPIIAVFFDFNIEGCSVAIKKIGYYVRTQVEPLLPQIQGGRLDAAFQPYELFMIQPRGRIKRVERISFNLAFTNGP